MKIPLLEMIHSSSSEIRITKELFYKYYGITRQGYSQGLKSLREENKMMEQIDKLVLIYRKDYDRRAGSRSLYYNLDIKLRYGIGVSKFEKLMSKHGMTLLPLRVRVVTTKSILQSWNYDNLCNGLIVNGINQLIVGDITYVSIGKERYYLFCLTDIFSARVVGHKISTRMRTLEALEALTMCKELRGKKDLNKCIHHTDGGGQYFSGKYIKAVGELNVKISVARSCLENGYAEQKNGFIKNHLIPTMRLKNEVSIAKEMSRLLMFYNEERKQENLGWLSPVEFEKTKKSENNQSEIVLHNHEKNLSSKRIGFSRQI